MRSYGALERSREEYLVDGGFVSGENIEVVAERGATIYAPVPEPRKKDVDRHAPRPDDNPAVAAWRVRMGPRRRNGSTSSVLRWPNGRTPTSEVIDGWIGSTSAASRR